MPLPKCDNIKCSNLVILKGDGTWSNYCSRECRGQFNSLKSRTKSKTTMMKNHGVEHALQNAEILEKMHKANMVKYSQNNPMKISSIAKSVVDTKIKRYGYPSSWSTEIAYQTHVDVAAIKYGYSPGMFTNVSQIPEVHEKKMKSGFLAKDYVLPSGKIIRIQGYEDKFLDIALRRYGEELFDFEDKSTIIYQYLDKIHHYHPDFIFNNNIVEVKSDHTFFVDIHKNIAKALGVLLSGLQLTFAIYRENGAASYITYSVERNYIQQSLDKFSIKYVELTQFNNYIVDFFLPEKNIAICYRLVEFTNETFCHKKYLNLLQFLLMIFHLRRILYKAILYY